MEQFSVCVRCFDDRPAERVEDREEISAFPELGLDARGDERLLGAPRARVEGRQALGARQLAELLVVVPDAVRRELELEFVVLLHQHQILAGMA